MDVCDELRSQVVVVGAGLIIRSMRVKIGISSSVLYKRRTHVFLGITRINTDAASLGLRIRIARRVELLLYRSFR
jgi:hypothetical protein